MHFMHWEDLFGPIGIDRTPQQKGARRRKYDLKNAQWQTLKEDTHFNGYEYAKGSHFKAIETTNFGFVVFRQDSFTPDGNVPGKFIHRY